MEKITRFFLIISCMLVAVVLGVVLFFFIRYQPNLPNQPVVVKLNKFDKFTSATELKEYLSAGILSSSYYGGSLSRSDFSGETAEVGLAPQTNQLSMPTSADSQASRFSETNVQVAGIDEPDIVKTNGQDIFASLERYYLLRPTTDGRARELINTYTLPSEQRPEGGVQAIQAFPIDKLKLTGKIKQQGEMLLSKNVLVVLASNSKTIYGYNITDSSNPQEIWQVKLDEKTWLKTARLKDDKIYLITSTYLNSDIVCPMPLLTDAQRTVELGCEYIYHPRTSVAVDETYTAIELDPQTGATSRRVSFVGSSYTSQVYMSNQAVYVSYYYPGDFVNYLVNFFKENQDIAPSWLVTKLIKLSGYEISYQSKMSEIMIIIQQWYAGLNKDESLKIENEFTNRWSTYAKAHGRELEKTGIAKIDLDKMQVVAAGDIPGTLLNQFAMDEYQNNLRVATTISGGGGFGWGNSNESVSDVYVLDKDLKQIGSVLGMGLTERIYAVRFLEDKGYVVTFRQTDPFYVLNLSNPKQPGVSGELKIPGYSSYLHPVNKDSVLGIGKEENKVKLSLFNVADPANPKEEDKYILDEYWSEVLNNHRAFLMDSKHQVFFLPGSKGGYIFSYENNKLGLKKAVAYPQVKRAVFIDDYLYVITDYNLVVLDEKNWEQVKELEF